jgi:hypothetical protein
VELHGEPLAQALAAFFEHARDAAKTYRDAVAYLAEHEGKQMKMKPTTPTPAEIAKRFRGDAGEAAWAEYAMRSSRDPRDAMDAIYAAFCKALAPVVELLKSQDGVTEAAATSRAFACCPSAYSSLRAAQNRVHANSSRESDAAVRERVMRVASIAKALCSEVSKSGGSGTAEARLLATAARFEWE